MVKRVNQKDEKHPKITQNCSICMSRAVNCKTIECSHEFCFRCLSKWTRRKGTCPLCRGDVRKIAYKKKVIEPDFLKNFDEEKIIREEYSQINPISLPVAPRLTLRAYLVVIPSIRPLPFTHALSYFPYAYPLP